MHFKTDKLSVCQCSIYTRIFTPRSSVTCNNESLLISKKLAFGLNHYSFEHQYSLFCVCEVKILSSSGLVSIVGFLDLTRITSSRISFTQYSLIYSGLYIKYENIFFWTRFCYNYLLTYLLTPWSRVLLEKLTSKLCN
jgi:hypothetical protein